VARHVFATTSALISRRFNLSLAGAHPLLRAKLTLPKYLVMKFFSGVKDFYHRLVKPLPATALRLFIGHILTGLPMSRRQRPLEIFDFSNDNSIQKGIKNRADKPNSLILKKC